MSANPFPAIANSPTAARKRELSASVGAAHLRDDEPTMFEAVQAPTDPGRQRNPGALGFPV